MLAACCMWLTSKWLKIFMTLISLALVSIFVIDIVLQTELNARFFFNELLNWALQWSITLPVAKSFFSTKRSILVILLYLDIIALFILSWKQSIKSQKTLLIMIIGSLISLSSFLPNWENAFFGFKLDNVFKANFSESWNIPYNNSSDNVKERFKLQYKQIDGLGTKKNVILIIFESLSSYESAFFRGTKDNSKIIDELASKNIAFINHHSNSYNTSQGIFNILTGIPIFHNAYNYLDFSNEKFYQYSLPRVFAKEGYQTVYFSPAPLVDNLDTIIQQSGFSEIHTDTDTFYKDKKKYVFNAVSDDVLFDNILMWCKQSHNTPYLLVASTITTHNPYIDPLTGEKSFEKTLQFSQQALKQFIDKLEAENFFIDGVLVITGDHRAMLSTSLKEYERWGPLASARVPLIISSNEPKKVDLPSSHTDIAATLEYMVLEHAYFNQFQRNLFQSETEEGDTYIFHQKLSPRNEVVVQKNDDVAVITLNGDDTSITQGSLPHEALQETFDFIRWLRTPNL